MIYWEEIKQKMRPKELHKSLIDPWGYLRLLVLPLSGDMIPRTSLTGLEDTNPDLHQEFINELGMLRDQDLNEESNSDILAF